MNDQQRMINAKNDLFTIADICADLYEKDTPRSTVIAMLQVAWKAHGDIFYDNRMSWLKLFTTRKPFYH